MDVLIVGKTRMHTGCCIGALSLETNQSLRLLEENGANPSRETAYQIGQVWSINFKPISKPRHPHTEDVMVTKRSYIGNKQNIRREIVNRIEPYRGGIDGLYQGLLRFTPNGSGYISGLIGVPNYSTCFWIPDRKLRVVREGTKVRYMYSPPIRLLAYVGFVEPVEIRAETLVRVSLARWWSPEDSDFEERCYLQLSGWYI